MLLVYFSSVAALGAYDQYRTCRHGMPRALEIKLGFKRTCRILVTKLGRVMTYLERLQPIKSYDPLIT